MEPPDGSFNPFGICDMMSSQNDLSIDPSIIQGTSADSAGHIPYQMYLDTSPSTDFSSSSGGQPSSSGPEGLNVNEVEAFFDELGNLSPEELEYQKGMDQERARVAQQMANMAKDQLRGTAMPPSASQYPTPPLGSEVSPRAAYTASYPQHAPGPSYPPANFSSPEMSSPNQPRRTKRARPSSPGTSCESYQMPLLPPQTPHSISSLNPHSPPFWPTEENSWVPIYDERQQQMNPLTMYINSRGLMYNEKQGAYINYRKTHLQVVVNIECVDCEAGLTPKFLWYNNFIPIKEFQVQVHGVRHNNPMSMVAMKQSDKDRKMYAPVFEGFKINETCTERVVKRLHFSQATLYNNQVNGKPNPKQEFFDLIVRLVAVTEDGNQYRIQSHMAQKIICRAGNPRVFTEDDENKNIKEEIEEEEEQPSQCWNCGNQVISTIAQVAVGGHEAVEGVAMTVRGDVFVSGAIRNFCDERCKNVYTEKVTEGLKTAYDQLRELKIFEFSYKEEFAGRMGLSTRRRDGFIAQQVKEVIPEAVVEMGDFLSVDQAEIFIKSVSALKHLSSMAEEMQGNLQETMKQVKYILDTVNTKKRIRASMASGLDDSRSRRSSVSTITSERRKPKSRVEPEQYPDILCGSRLSQCTIITVVVALVFVMAACLVSMTFLYFVDLTSRYGHNPVPTVFVKSQPPPPANMVMPVNQLASLQQNVSMLSPKCEGDHCHHYCCDSETLGNASAQMINERIVVPWRDDEESKHLFGPLRPDVSIFIPELNVTLDKKFCVSQSCNKHRHEYKLFIPLSPAFPKAPLRVKFIMAPGKLVEICGEVPGFHQKKCMSLVNKEKSYQIRQIDDVTFELPVGAYLQSGYRFHVGYSPEPCSHYDVSPSPATQEYNLIFYRKCM